MNSDFNKESNEISYEDSLIKLSFENINLENSIKDEVMSKIYFQSEKVEIKNNIVLPLVSVIIFIFGVIIFQRLFLSNNLIFVKIFSIIETFSFLKEIITKLQIDFSTIQISSITVLVIIFMYFVKKGSVKNEK